MYQQQKKVCEKRKSHKRVTILKQNKLIPKLMKIFFSFEKKKRNKKSKEHVGHLLASSSNHSKFGYRVYSIKRMCDYFFLVGKEGLLLLLMLRFRVVVWKLQNVVFIAIPKTLHPATAITTRIHHPRGIPSNNKPKKQEQRNTTSSYLAHAPLLLLFLFSLFLSTCLCFLFTNSFTYHIPFWNPCQKVKL